jgi:hypothetical protein
MQRIRHLIYIIKNFYLIRDYPVKSKKTVPNIGTKVVGKNSSHRYAGMKQLTITEIGLPCGAALLSRIPDRILRKWSVITTAPGHPARGNRLYYRGILLERLGMQSLVWTRRQFGKKAIYKTAGKRPNQNCM